MSNLIEKLGGYEKAKSIRDINIKEFEGDASGVTIHYMGNSITQEDLEESLLEYRRQHNIFEVGDWVYPLVKMLDHHEGVGLFICANIGELVVVREVRTDRLFVSHEHRHDNSFRVMLNEIRHTTDEEIAAGRRL